jgi:hypothetical protein
LLCGLRAPVQEEDAIFDEFSWNIKEFFDLVRHRRTSKELRDHQESTRRNRTQFEAHPEYTTRGLYPQMTLEGNKFLEQEVIGRCVFEMSVEDGVGRGGTVRVA